MIKKILSPALLILLLLVCTGPLQGAAIIDNTGDTVDLGAGVVVSISGDSQTGGGGEGAGAFDLTIDLLKITPTGMVHLKSETIKARDNTPVEYKFGFRPSAGAEIISFTLKILPTIVKSVPLEMQFKINLFREDTELQEQIVSVGAGESVMVELMENKKTGAKLSFRLTPSLKSGKDAAAQLAAQYKAEKQFFQDPTQHQAGVSVKLLPIFAVDDDGNPVYDLKKEDIQFLVNGSPGDVLHLKPYDFGKKGKDAAGGKGKDKLQKEPDRVIILIVDQVFNSWAGIRRAKKIAADFIKKGEPGDFFILMANTPAGGLKYIAGPDNDTKKLLSQIDRVTQLPQRQRRDLYSSLELPSVSKGWGLQSQATEEEDPSVKSYADSTRTGERLKYKADVQRFAQVLSQFKYALKTIETPKIVFLISKGVARSSFHKVLDLDDFGTDVSVDVFLFDYFKKVSKAVNEGGSVLYTVNSQKVNESVDRGESGRDSLEEMAVGSGGKYFSAVDTVDITNQVNRTLSAYYELVFNPNMKMGEGMEVSITSKRPGVTIHTVKHSEIERPYHKMEKLQKKLFALNLVNGGNWSRMVAKIEKTKSKTLSKDKTKTHRMVTKQVMMPEGLKNSEVDIFVVKKNPKTQKVQIDMITRKVGDRAEIGMKGKKGQDLFYVIIEPKYVRCVAGKAY